MGDLVPVFNLRPRQLRRIAASKKVPPIVQAGALYAKIMEQLDSGRVPLDVGSIALQLALDECRDQLAPNGSDMELGGVNTGRPRRMSGDDRLAVLCARILGADE